MSAAVTHGRTATEEARRDAAAHRRTRHRNLQPLTGNVLTPGPVEDTRRKQTLPTARSGGTRRTRPRSAGREEDRRTQCG
jgi:hypothetical protein